jgi:hypothetical protein
MKKLLLFLVFIFITSFAISQDNVDEETPTDLERLEQENQELKTKYNQLNKKFDDAIELKDEEINRIVNLLRETQYKTLVNNDSLLSTKEHLSELKTKTETHEEGMYTFIIRNRINLIVVVIILVLLNFIIFLLMNNRMSKNAMRVENNFIQAYESFNGDIKAASSLLNKHIKETKRDLDEQVKDTRSQLDTEISETKKLLADRIDNTQKCLDEEVKNSQQALSEKIAEEEQKLLAKIEETKKEIDIQLKETKKAIVEERQENLKVLEEKISENKRRLEDHFKDLKNS